MEKKGTQLITREKLSKRWACSTRKVDRLRQDGLLPWIDLSCGRGKRASVRFLLADIEEFEIRYRLQPTINKINNL